MSARTKIEKEPNYAYVAARLLLGNVHKEVFGSSVDKDAFDHQYRLSFIKNIKLLVKEGILSEKLLEFDLKGLSEKLEIKRDYLFKYLGLQTLYDRYFHRLGDRRLESPQSFWMRVAMGLAINEKNKNKRAIEFYETISTFRLCPSTPTLFNSGSVRSQLSSCYLNTFDDSIDGIFEGAWQEARKSKFAGGLGFDVSNFRSSGSYIKGTNGYSSGLVPWLKIFNDLLVAVNQGGKRPGAGCAYLEPWHLDIEDFLELKKNTGDERRRCHDMNTAHWLPDMFFRVIEKNADWYLFSPAEVDLHNCYGKEFNRRYKKYCKMADEGKIKNFKKVPVKDLWKKMLRALYETGHPWLTFKDSANLRYSNAHEGMINSSNLCTEIFCTQNPQSTAKGKKQKSAKPQSVTSVSVNLKTHLNSNGKLNFKLLAKTIATQMRMLDNVIDLNFYPTKEAEKSNFAHRPVGAGTMGWADVFHSYKISFSSKEAVRLSDELYEFVSYHCILNSNKLSKERGPYNTYTGSLWSLNKLPIDTYKDLMVYLEQKPIIHKGKNYVPTTINWKGLREDIKNNGMRNSNTMAIAPTATISYIQGCASSVEPDFSTLFVYENKSGNLMVANEWFVKECKQLGIWNPALIEMLKAVNGDVNRLNGEIPDSLKQRYQTAFDHDQFNLIDCGAAKQKWIDMGQSLNLFNNFNSLKYLNDLYFHARRRGLKSTYYLRNKSASEIEKSTSVTTTEPTACSVVSGSDCESCQ